MHAVLLLIHLMVAIVLIGIVLLQRSEGGALGMGGGGGGLMSSRGAATALTKTTVGVAIAFFLTSIGLSLLGGVGGGSVLDTVDPLTQPARQGEPVIPLGNERTPGSDGTDAPAPDAGESQGPSVPLPE